MGMMKEFKEFAVKGNVIDLAVGVIIGAAFSKIVDSIVGDLIMPVAGAIFGKIDFSNLFILGCLFFFYVGEMIFYFSLYSYLKYRRSKGYFIHRVLIVGLNDMSVLLRQLIIIPRWVMNLSDMSLITG